LLGINRTSVELKQCRSVGKACRCAWINRTSVELKRLLAKNKSLQQ